MKNVKSLINSLFGWGTIIMLLSCSNDGENIGMYSDEEFHEKVVKLQNKYNSSLKIDESRLRKDEETLTNISDIMCTIKNNDIDYELIISEEGGLIAMPILKTTSTKSYSSEVNTVSYTLSHSVLPCDIVVSGEDRYFQIKSNSRDYHLVNVSCAGSVTQNYIIFNGKIKIRSSEDVNYTIYTVYCKMNYSESIFEVIKED